MRLPPLFYAITLLTASSSALAVELRYEPVRNGTAGLVHAPFIVRDATSEPLSCETRLAHWYSSEPVIIAPGAMATVDLWFDPETGTYAALNVKSDNMPVESLWCGVAGRAYETRAEITLDRTATPQNPRAVVCSMSSAGLACR